MTVQESAPVVVDTFPKSHALVEGGVEATISVTFDQKMDGGCSWVNQGFWDYPKVIGEHFWSEDERTHSIKVRLEKGKTYVLSINSAEYRNFAARGVPAIPYIMSFRTKA